MLYYKKWKRAITLSKHEFRYYDTLYITIPFQLLLIYFSLQVPNIVLFISNSESVTNFVISQNGNYFILIILCEIYFYMS